MLNAFANLTLTCSIIAISNELLAASKSPKSFKSKGKAKLYPVDLTDRGMLV